MKKLFLGIKGHVVCLDQQTGIEQWRKMLRSSTITNVVYDGECLHAYSRGHIYALNPDNGIVLWENSLSGLGYGYCIIATEGSSSYTQAASSLQAQQAAAGAAAATAATGAANANT